MIVFKKGNEALRQMLCIEGTAGDLWWCMQWELKRNGLNWNTTWANYTNEHIQAH